MGEGPAAVADRELRVPRLAVVRGGHVAGEDAGVAPAADILERAVAGLGHRGRAPRSADIGILGSGRGQHPEQVRTVHVGAVRDPADLGLQVVTSEPVRGESLAGVGDGIRVGPAADAVPTDSNTLAMTASTDTKSILVFRMNFSYFAAARCGAIFRGRVR